MIKFPAVLALGVFALEGCANCRPGSNVFGCESFNERAAREQHERDMELVRAGADPADVRQERRIEELEREVEELQHEKRQREAGWD